VPRSTGSRGVAGDVNPDTETIHPSDPDGNPAGLARDDTRDTEADPTPNTQEAAEKNPESGIPDEFVIEDPPEGTNRGGRTPNPRNLQARTFVRSHPGKFIRVGVYEKKVQIPEILRVIDGMKVVTQWANEKDNDGNATGRFLLYLKLTDQPYVKRERKPRTAPSVDPTATTAGMEHEDGAALEDEVKAD